METNGGKRLGTDYQNRVHIVLVVGGAITRVSCGSGSTFTSPVHHLGNNHDTELTDRADFTTQDGSGSTVLLYRDESRVVEGITHVFQSHLQFATHIGHITIRDGLGVHHGRAGNDLGLLRGAKVDQIHSQTLQVFVVHYRRRGALTSDGSMGGSSTAVTDSSSRGQQVDLQGIFGHLVGAQNGFTADGAVEIILGIEVQSFLRELVEEAELLERTFQSQTSETNTVHTATLFSQGRQLAVDGAYILGRTIQVTVGDLCTTGVDTLIVDVAVIQQRHDVILDDLLTVVLRHRGNVSQLTEVLLFGGFDQCSLPPVASVDLWASRTVGAVPISHTDNSSHNLMSP